MLGTQTSSLPRHEVTAGTVRVRSDVFPAAVEFSFMANPYPKCRSIVTADEVLVLVEDGTPPGVLYRGRLENLEGNRSYVVATTSDGTIRITRGGGCACGSRLRSYRPFGRTVAMARK